MPSPAMDQTAVEARLRQVNWYHSIDFGHGLRSSGIMPLDRLAYDAGLMFDRYPVAGKSVLDVGAWDGFFSFEAKRRGAARVLATDYYCWSGPGWGTKQGFELARELLSLGVEDKEIDVPDLSPTTVGHFDVVLFAGVLYHLKHPLEAIERLAGIASEMMIVETHLDAEEYDRPAMIFYPGRELNNDPTNWWGPNPACVTEMLQVAGFRTVDFTRSSLFPQRGFFHARK